jgi:hypothetical protein
MLFDGNSLTADFYTIVNAVISNRIGDPLSFQPIAEHKVFVGIPGANFPHFARNIAASEPILDRNRTGMTFE